MKSLPNPRRARQGKAVKKSLQKKASRRQAATLFHGEASASPQLTGKKMRSSSIVFDFRYLIDNRKWENDWNADKYLPNTFGGDDSVVIT